MKEEINVLIKTRGTRLEDIERAQLCIIYQKGFANVDRILAGTWSEAELGPAVQKYAEERRHLHTPEWVGPNAKDQ